MMQTFTVPMHIKHANPAVIKQPRLNRRHQPAYKAFVLAEIVVVISIISMAALLAMINIPGLINKYRFKLQAEDLISVLRMAVTGAAESNKRYEVILDITGQNYTLREITSPDLTEVLEEEIIQTSLFSDICMLFYVQFDDLQSTQNETSSDLRAFFRAGRSGWQYGGKIVLLDKDRQPYSIVITRMSGKIDLQKGDRELLQPKSKDELPF